MSNEINKFFDKVYVINLFDKEERWKKMEKQFKNRKIKVERFIAVDGRCKTQGKEGCIAKMKTFEMVYSIKISNKNKYPLQEVVPAASLTIGTVVLLRDMVKTGYEHILICEDDIELGRSFSSNFKRGIDELKGTKFENWDVLYLGCGHKCGNSGVSLEKTSINKYLSTATQTNAYDYEIYLKHPNDLRTVCDEGECPEISEHMSVPGKAGGSWCYAFSLKGAKKFLKLIDNDAGNHVDHIYQTLENKGGIKAVAFNPPIVWHEGGGIRADTDIPWAN